MSRFHSHLQSAKKVIISYDGSKPFVFHLKAFFAAEKKYGSRDRKTIASLCYGFFRLGHAMKKATVEERVLMGVFLTENKSNALLTELRPEWNEKIELDPIEKLQFLNLTPNDIFPFAGDAGEGLDKELLSVSFLHQPQLYLRTRPGKRKIVTDKLTAANLSFEQLEGTCIQLINATSLDTVIKINKDAVVQDKNSQRVLGFLEKNREYFPGTEKIHAWDCCAASGGKSILLNDILKGRLMLSVSDVRENILLNLEKRLQQAGVNIQKKFKADLQKSVEQADGETFDLILFDAPCTGSGTWARTPEQLYYFSKDTIKSYATRQKEMVVNIAGSIKPGGLLFYITCSVFQQENEQIVSFIQEKFPLRLLEMEYLKGYEEKADTMFVAVFTA